MFQSPTTYNELVEAIKMFDRNRKEFIPVGYSQFKNISASTSASGLQATGATSKNGYDEKLQHLASQLAELSLLVKKSQRGFTKPPIDERPCSYCGRRGHGANKFPDNPHRGTRCTYCSKVGHAEPACWAKARVSGENDSKKNQGQLEIKKVTFAYEHSLVVTEGVASSKPEVVAALKRNAQGEPLPKQHHSAADPRPTPSMVGPMEYMPPHRQSTPGVLIGVPPKNRRAQRKKTAPKSNKVARLSSHVGRYSLLTELARAPSGITFGQLVRGDADDAKREMQKLFRSGTRKTKIATVGDTSFPRRLKLVPVKIYSKEAQALLDSGAIPNLMSSRLSDELSLIPSPTSRQITVANGDTSQCIGTVSGVPVSFTDLVVPIDFLVVLNTPFDLIIGCPTLETMAARLDLRKQMVKLSFQGRTVHLGLEYDRSSTHVVNAGTDSEDFTSGVEGELNDTGESDDVSSLSDSEEYVVTILSNTAARKNIEEHHFAASVTPVLEEYDADDGMLPLPSDDEFSEIDDEMTESGDLTEDVVFVADIRQEDCNEEQDFSDYDTYYLVGNSLERIQERSHDVNASPQICDALDNRVGNTLRGFSKEGTEPLFHFCHSRDCQGITGEPCMAVPSETPVPNPNGNTDPNPIATQTEGEVMENDIPRDNEEEGSVNDEVDEAPQEQFQPPTSPSAEPEMDLSAPPEDLDIPEPENGNQVANGSVAPESENEYPEYEVQDVEEDEEEEAAQEEGEPGGFPWNDDSDDDGPSPATYWGIPQDPEGNVEEAPTVPPPSPTAGNQGNRNRSRQNGTSGANESARPETTPSPDRTGIHSEELEDQLAIIHENIGHLPPAYRNALLDMLLSKDIVAWCLEDLRPAKVPVTHSFDLTD